MVKKKTELQFGWFTIINGLFWEETLNEWQFRLNVKKKHLCM